MNRVGLGLAIGAGYLLGRTKKLKFAIAVGTMVAGKKLNLTPKGIAELASSQLQNNPQFKEIGDQLRTDLQGVGKAASGALVERQIGALADRLHGRTAEMRDQVSGVASRVPGVGSDDSDDSRDSRDSDDSRDSEASEDSEPYAEDEREDEGGDEPEDEGGERRRERRQPRREGAAKKTSAEPRKTAKKAPAKKAAAKRAQPARKAAGKKTAGTRQTKGGGER